MTCIPRRMPFRRDELFDLPDDDYKYELVEGGLIRMASTGGGSSLMEVPCVFFQQFQWNIFEGGLVGGG